MIQELKDLKTLRTEAEAVKLEVNIAGATFQVRASTSKYSERALHSGVKETLTPMKPKDPSRTNPHTQQGQEKGGLDKRE